jgi:hypothetical protein
MSRIKVPMRPNRFHDHRRIHDLVFSISERLDVGDNLDSVMAPQASSATVPFLSA